MPYGVFAVVNKEAHVNSAVYAVRIAARGEMSITLKSYFAK